MSFVFPRSESGYICMVIYQREGHIIEVQQSSKFSLNS